MLISTIKTTLLLSALTALLVFAGYVIGGSSGAIIFFLISLVTNFVSFFFSDKIALAMSGAKPLSENQAPEIFEDVREISRSMGIPSPRLYYTEDIQPNAFATGRDYNHSAVAVTAGLLQVLDRNEVRGVLAHELAHIKNRDVLISTIAAVIAGTISSLAQIGIFFGGGSDDENRNPIVFLLALILAPISAVIIQLSISRTREYKADETAARYTKEPQYLANALEKIHTSVKQGLPIHTNDALSSLYIQNPFRAGGLTSLFSTHPPVEKRIARLMSLKV